MRPLCKGEGWISKIMKHTRQLVFFFDVLKIARRAVICPLGKRLPFYKMSLENAITFLFLRNSVLVSVSNRNPLSHLTGS